MLSFPPFNPLNSNASHRQSFVECNSNELPNIFFFYKKSAPFSKSRHTSLRNSFKSFFKIIKNKMFFLYVARLSKSEIDVPSQLHVSESKK